MWAEAFAQDEFSVREVQRWMKLRALAALQAMIGPESLRAITQFDLLERLMVWMSAGE